MSLLNKIGFNKGNKPAERAPTEARQADLGETRSSRFRPMMGLLNRTKPETESAAPQAKQHAPRRQAAGELRTRMDAQKHKKLVADQNAVATTQAAQKAEMAQAQAELAQTQTELAKAQAEADTHMESTKKVADILRNFDLGSANDLTTSIKNDPMMDEMSLVTDELSTDDLDALIAETEVEMAAQAAAEAAADADIDGSQVTDEISMDDLDAQIAATEIEIEAAGKALSDRVDKMQIDNQKKAQAEADNEAAQAQVTTDSAGKALSDRVDKMQIDNQKRALAEANSEAAQAQAAADSAGQALSERLDKMQLNNQRKAEVEAEMEALQAQVDAEPAMSQAPNLIAENDPIEARFQALMGGQKFSPSVGTNKSKPQVTGQPLPTNSSVPAHRQALVQAQLPEQSAKLQSRPTVVSPQARQTHATQATNRPARPINAGLNPAQNNPKQEALNNIIQMQKRHHDGSVARAAVSAATRVTQEMVRQKPSLTINDKKGIYERTVQRTLAKELQKNNPMIAGKSRDDNFLIGDKNVNVGRYIDFKVQQFIEKNPESLKPPAYLRVN
jgi:hypothetical protein